MLRKAGIRLEEKQLSQLWSYHNLIRKRNQDGDLTRLFSFHAMAIKHYLDCLMVAKLTRLPSPIIDVGTGAGFPGIPLKIFLPQIHFILAEPRPRRIEFLKEAIRTVGLKSVEVFEHKVTSQSFARPVYGVITRALETMDKTLLRTSGATQPGTRLIFMKGPNVDAELKDIEVRFADKVKLIEDHDYVLPGTDLQRRLIVYEAQS